jgi:hypothetical protein
VAYHCERYARSTGGRRGLLPFTRARTKAGGPSPVPSSSQPGETAQGNWTAASNKEIKKRRRKTEAAPHPLWWLSAGDSAGCSRAGLPGERHRSTGLLGHIRVRHRRAWHRLPQHGRLRLLRGQFRLPVRHVLLLRVRAAERT